MDTTSLLTQLTLAEKAGLTSGADAWQTKAVERLGIPAVRVADGPHGLRVERESEETINLDDSHPATCFPPAVALGSTWNPQLVHEVGQALGDEAAALGVGVLLGPGINIKRSPLCGRNFEYLSEDPHLTGTLAAAYIDGVQSRGVGTAVKHFAANNQETDRMRVNVEVDERTLREIYLRAFEIVARDAKPWMLMSSYNFLNGRAMSDNRDLLTGALREEWGFDGVVVSDWGAVYDRVASVAAGLDLEMPTTSAEHDEQVVAAIESGVLAMEDLDASAARVLLLAERTRRSSTPTVDVGANDELAARAAAEAIVMLRNEGGILPLDPHRASRLTVVGDFAAVPRFQGAGSSQVNATRVSDALDAITTAVGPEVALSYAQGFERSGEVLDETLAAEAVRAAAASDAVLLFLGLPERLESEGFDRESLELPAPQVELLSRVAATGTPVIVVLSNGGVVVTHEWQHHTAAILEGWLLGQAGGRAIARVLFGEESPSGRLAETIPERLEQTSAFHHFPGYAGTVRYGEGVFVGYRHYETVATPVSYPFGFGLSYSTFTQTIDHVAGHGAGDDLRVTLQLTVTNTGPVTAKEVVQLYVEPPAGLPSRPRKELRALRKVELAPGASAQLAIELDYRAFAFWDERTAAWTVQSGSHVLHLGKSARDSHATEAIEVRGHDRAVPLSTYSTLREWREHPRGAALLTAFPGFETLVGPTATVAEMTLLMLENIPLVKLVQLFGFATTAEQVTAAIGEANG